MSARALFVGCASLVLVACATGIDDGTPAPTTDGALSEASFEDAPVGDSASPPNDAPPNGDSTTPPTDTFVPPIDSPNGLDPQLVLPAAGGAACSTIGSSVGCPGDSVCRISSTSGGTCESCVGCGNLGASCRYDVDCDILFQCYEGKCEGFCALGTTACGAPSDCIDVGNATTGVCKPL